MHINKYSALVSRICHSPGMPVCSEDLPETDFDFCDPDVRLSEIRRVFLARPNADSFEDWSSRTEWAGRLTQIGMHRDAIRTLTCIGDKPIPNSIRKVISGDRRRTTAKEHTVNITIDEVTDANHEFVKKLKGGKPFKAWYETMGGLMLGGNNGINCMVYGDMELKRGKGEIIGYELQLVWDNKRTEDRIESPIFDLDAGSCSNISEVVVDSFDDSSIAFHWGPQPSATYQWAINTSGDEPSEGDWNDTTLTSDTATDLDPDTDYYIFVRTVCYNGIFGVSVSVMQHTDIVVEGGPPMPVTDFILALASEYGVIDDVDNPGYVGSWLDYSTNANEMAEKSNDGAAQLIPLAFGTEPGIRFSGNSLFRSASQLNIGTTQQLHLFFVITSPSINNTIFEYTEDGIPASAGSSKGMKIMSLDDGSGGISIRTVVTGGQTSTLNLPSPSTPALIEIIMDNTVGSNQISSLMHRTGSFNTAGSSGAILSGDFISHRLLMASAYDGGTKLSAGIACVYLYGRVLNSTERGDTILALNTRYSI